MRRPWPEWKIDRLKRQWAEGLSADLIAEGLSVTRNAVIGKAHRLHLPSRTEVTTRSGQVRVMPKRQVTKRGVPLSDLRDSSCRWPLDDGLYCGDPVVRGSYCSTHSKASYRDAESKSIIPFPRKKRRFN